MGMPTRTRRNRARALRLALVAFAFVGLFAMHGLADHGTMHSETSAPMAMAATHHGGDVTAMAGDSETGHSPMERQAVEDPSIDPSGMVGLCFAVLAGSLLALAWLRSRNPIALVRHWPYPVTVNLAATELRERDPPCLFELSIQRC